MAAQTLPVELVSMIASELDDLSLSRLSRTCRHLHHALSNSCEAWRWKYSRFFDGSIALPVEELAVKYKALKFLLRPSHRTSPEKRVGRSGQVHGRPCSYFEAGRTANEMRVLAAVKVMIRDASMQLDSSMGLYRSYNIGLLHHFTMQYDLYARLGQSNRPLRETHEDLFLVQVMLVHELFYRPNNTVHGIPEAQTVVYGTEHHHPILRGPRCDVVNLKYLRSAINVLYSAMVTELWEGYGEWPFELLYSRQQPKPWLEKLEPGVKEISTNWLGAWCSARVPGDVTKIRQDAQYASRHNVENNIDDTFEGMHLVFIEDKMEEYDLRREVDMHLKSASHPSMAYWQELAQRIQEIKDAGGQPTEADELLQREATRKAAAKRHKSNLWGFVSDFLTTVEMDKEKNPDIIEDMDSVRTAPLMFKLASGRENLAGGAVAQDASLGFGYLQPLPSQRGIPGWMRITMIKFKWPAGRSVDADGIYPRFMSKHSNDFFWSVMAADMNLNNNNDNDADDEGDDEIVVDHIDHDQCWAYEGIVLPGGKFMVGRWWWVNPDDPDGMRKPNSTQQSGPFMYWDSGDIGGERSTVPALQGWEDV